MNEELIDLTTEDNIDVDIEEVVETEIKAEDSEYNIEANETVDIVETEIVEEIDIEFEEEVGWVGGDNTRHYSLYGREEPDQHPITAITGLREELDNIEVLDVVYSNERYQADYYLWEDENILQEDRVGYFVSACSDINKIKFCDSENLIFGVTVDKAGFIGAQDDISRDIKYGLVVTVGVVHVRCESDVVVGDYVISNNYGYATKNKIGYKVVGVHDINGVEHAEIILTTPIGGICELSDDLEDIGNRMDNAETNIVAAINVANAAYNKAGEVSEISEEAIKNALEALDKANNSSEKTDGFESRLENANQIAVQARAISESAVTSAETTRKEAINTANNALANVLDAQKDIDDLIKDMEPLAQWESADGKQSGIVGFIARANADSATLATLAEWKEDEGDSQSIAGTIAKVNEHDAILNHITSKQGVNGSTIAQVEQKADDNGASITNLVASVDKYSVGEYSQAYGLTREQAIKILKPGYIYIPTENYYKCCETHVGVESHCETFFFDDGTIDEINEFTPGNYYVWTITDISGYTVIADWDIDKKDANKVYYTQSDDKYYYYTDDNWTTTDDPLVAGLEVKADWIEYTDLVTFSSSPPANSNNKYKYWYIDSEKPMIGYESYSLYIWEDAEWKKVNTLAGNVNNRATSMLRQTTNEIALELTNARGSATTLEARLSETDSCLTGTAQWAKDDVSEGLYNLATIQQIADDGGSSLALVVADTKGNKILKGASIVLGQSEEEDSYIKVSADNIHLEGMTTVNNGFGIDYDGYMYATGGKIGNWSIVNNQITATTETSEDGDTYNVILNAPETKDNGVLVVQDPNKWITYFGLYADGSITATRGKIGAWTISEGRLTANPDGYQVLLNAPKTKDNGVLVIQDTNTGSTNQWPFSLYADGRLICTKGRIGGWTIGQYNLTGGNVGMTSSSDYGYAFWAGAANGGDAPFRVGHEGRLRATDAYITGEIVATKGTFTGTVNASYGSFSRNMTVAGRSISNWINSSGYAYVDGIKSSGILGSQGYVKIDDSNTNVVKIQHVNPSVTVSGVEIARGWTAMVCSSAGAYVYNNNRGSLVGTWTDNSGVGITSDKNCKNSIADIDDKYEAFFDDVQPRIYKYNDGTSNRIHTGFIAQEVEEAIVNNNLTTQDLAITMLMDDLDVKTNISHKQYYLRYNEFVALNTWQIQKAKTRITELEEKVAKLESLIKGE